MKALAKRLVRLEERFTPVEHDYLRNPRARHRLTITNIGKQLSLETSTCRRTLSADGGREARWAGGLANAASRYTGCDRLFPQPIQSSHAVPNRLLLAGRCGAVGS
jgi:hypothetical protein